MNVKLATFLSSVRRPRMFMCVMFYGEETEECSDLRITFTQPSVIRLNLSKYSIYSLYVLNTIIDDGVCSV